MSSSVRISWVGLTTVVLSARYAAAQTPINAPSAMQPSTGTAIVRGTAAYREVGSDRNLNVSGGQEWIVLSQTEYGLRHDLSVQLELPIVYREFKRSSSGSGSDDEFGLGDSTLLAKYRVYQDDPGPTETTRFSLIGGLQIPGNVALDMDSSNDAWDPIIGAVSSTVFGRNGFNASVLWEFYTGNDHDQSDSMRYDASHLFRLSPPRYTLETSGALYSAIELNGFYGTNGDHELYLSPGIMWESKTVTLDATVMIPVHQDVDHRAESEFIVAAGVRLLF